jgi:alpha-galactosidase-like CBM13-containing protein
MKKQINPSIKAHLLWSAPTIRLVGALFLDLCSKKSQLRLAAFRDKIMQLPGFPLIGLIVFGGVLPGLAALASASDLPEENIISHASLQPSAATHETRVGSQAGLQGAYTAAGSGGYSNVMTATTAPTTGLLIQATFDSSITENPNAAAIEAMINQAISIYESLFSDPMTIPIQILFRYSDTAPNGDPLPGDVLSQSLSTVYTVPWNDFVSALRADATSSNDSRANASLPGSPLSPNIAPSSANGRAVGLNTPPAIPDPTAGQGGPYDGIVTLNSAIPFSFTRPLLFGSFDAQRSVEHEIDEVMGLGSYLNTANAPRPCTSYEAESPICPQPPGEECSIVAGGAVIQPCLNCSGGFDVGFVGNNSGTLQFNQVFANASGRLDVRIWYANGDAAVRYAFLSVNGGPGTSLTFPSTGSFQTVGSIQTTLNFLNPGSNNTLEFSNPIVGNWAPDFDRIEVTCTIPPPASLRPQDLFSWSSPGVRNLTLDGSRYFSIDSGSTDIVGFNQTPPGDFGDWLSEACPQRHPFVQNAFVCRDQFSDISATSPEGINLDVIGYDLVNAVVTTDGNPVVTTGRASNITRSSAILNGTVNPNGLTTTVAFQYGKRANYGSITANRTYTGNTTQSVSVRIPRLRPNTTYHFRLVETNNGGASYGSDRTFRTRR